MSFSLEINHLSKKYASDFPLVLANFGLRVKSGEIVALLGESGSGKTTLLRLIAGLEYPTNGEILIYGSVVASESKFTSPEKREVGLVFQDYALFPHLNIQKNVAYGVRGNKAEKQKSCSEMLALVGLSELSERFPHEISGGQQQRVALARALATKPKLLLLDEPFSNLDEGLKTKVRADLKNIVKKAGITAIFVTHDTQDALAVADKIALLNNGKLEQFDSPKNLYRKPISKFVAHYFGKVNWLSEEMKSEVDSTKTTSQKQVGFRPHQFRLATEGIEFTIENINYYGNELEVMGKSKNQELTINLRENADLEIGETVFLKTVGEPIVL